jgi:hypothetical protein
MPEYAHEDKTAFRTLPVHFRDQEAVDAFAERVGLTITPHTRFLWFPAHMPTETSEQPRELRPIVDEKRSELVTLKFSLWGMSLDLKELFRRCITLWKGKR